MSERGQVDLSDLSPTELAEVIDLVERLRERRAGRAAGAGDVGTLEDPQAWIASLRQEDATPEEADAIDAAKAEDRAGAPRVSADEARKRWG